MLQTNTNNDYNYGYSNNKQQLSIEQRSRQISIKNMLYIFLTLAFIGLLVVAYMGQSLQITHLSYQLTGLNDNLKQIEEKNHHLNIKLAQSKSLSRIEKIARTRLHMVDPGKTEVVVLNNPEPKPDVSGKKQDKMFLARVFDNFLERVATAKASGLN